MQMVVIDMGAMFKFLDTGGHNLDVHMIQIGTSAVALTSVL